MLHHTSRLNTQPLRCLPTLPGTQDPRVARDPRAPATKPRHDARERDALVWNNAVAGSGLPETEDPDVVLETLSPPLAVGIDRAPLGGNQSKSTGEASPGSRVFVGRCRGVLGSGARPRGDALDDAARRARIAAPPVAITQPIQGGEHGSYTITTIVTAVSLQIAQLPHFIGCIGAVVCMHVFTPHMRSLCTTCMDPTLLPT